MKKIIFLVASIIAIGTAALSGCDNGKVQKNDIAVPDNVIERVQDELSVPECGDEGKCPDCEKPDRLTEYADENTDEEKMPEPEPRKPHKRRRGHRPPHEQLRRRHREQQDNSDPLPVPDKMPHRQKK